VIVVDTNIIAYFLLPYDKSPLAEELFRRDPEWAVPILWRSEFRNLLAGYYRRGTFSFDQVLHAQSEAESLLAGNEHEVDSRRVLELVRDSKCTAYDCEFIALAARLGTKLVTEDRKLLQAFPMQAASLSEA
jgi:predicted nucleic acid-binding protein